MKKILFIALLFVACNHDASRQPWPDGKIPFILSGFQKHEEAKIVESMMAWELASDKNVEFFVYGTRATENKPLLIFKDAGCMVSMSSTGYGEGGLNYCMLNMHADCIIPHELGHVLGLNHEHCRPDRDMYIKIKFEDSIPLLFSIQFIPIEPLLYDYRKYPFDYDSIMMYNSHPAEGVYIDAGGRKLGSETISIIDALKVRDMYSF